MFAYIYFNVPQPEYQIWLEMYQMKKFIDMEQPPLSMFLLLSTWFVFSLLDS